MKLSKPILFSILLLVIGLIGIGVFYYRNFTAEPTAKSSQSPPASISKALEKEAMKQFKKNFKKLDKKSTTLLLDRKCTEIKSNLQKKQSLNELKDLEEISKYYSDQFAMKKSGELDQIIVKHSRATNEMKIRAYLRLAGGTDVTENRYDRLDRKHRYYDKALELIEKNTAEYAKIVYWKGNSAKWSNNSRKMVQFFDEFLQLPDSSKTTLRKLEEEANLQLARLYAKRPREKEKAKKYYNNLLEVFKKAPKQFGDEQVLTKSCEAIKSNYASTPNKCHLELERLAKQKRFSGLRLTLFVSNSVYWHKFENRGRDFQNYQDFSNIFLEHLKTFKKSEKDENGKMIEKLDHFEKEEILNFQYFVTASYAAALADKNKNDGGIPTLKKSFVKIAEQIERRQPVFPDRWSKAKKSNAVEFVDNGIKNVFKLELPN